ncbi:hypothetical protein IW261DRAFT_1632962, partial [Armillaria novae-zelandiae]
MATVFYNPFEDPQHPPTTPEYKTEVVDPLLYTDGHVKRPKKSWLLHILCFSLHAVLIGLHVLLLFVWFTHFEHKVVVPIGKKGNILSTAIVQVSQLFATIYLSVLIFITQQLATRRNLHERQTLTATHDNMSAWTGLGAALMALWRQTTIAATVIGVFLVSAYFVCVGVLSITAPALFSLQPFNTSRHSVISTTLGPPNISINNLFWLDSTPVIPYLSHSDRISKIGLENGTLYDVLSNNNGEGEVYVNALTFNVTCGFVDGVSITPIPNTGNWSVDTVYDDHVQPIPVLGELSSRNEGTVSHCHYHKAPNTFKWLPYYNYNFRDPWRHALFYTSANITDSNGSKGNPVSLQPPMRPGTYMKNVNYFDEATVYTMQVIGCTITLINQTAVVDAQTHLLKRVYPSGRKTSSTWSQWNPETIPANAKWWNLFDQAATSRFPSTDDCPGFPWSNPDICNPLTVVEQFVMEDLGLHSILLDSPVRPAPVIALHDLENSIASATAASYWAALYAKAGGLKNDDPYNVDNVNNFKVEAMAGNATITYPYTAMRLNINLIPVAVGLGASIGLLVLAYQVVGKPIAGDSGVDTIGVLQILWLMRTRPDLQRVISEVEEPSVDNLRRTGM